MRLRRLVLGRHVLARLAVGLVGVALVAGCTASGHRSAASSRSAAGSTSATPTTTATASPAPTPTRAAAVSWPSAAAVRIENAVAGSKAWQLGISFASKYPLNGFADHASVQPGTPVRLFVSSLDGPVSVQAFRMGWYGGAGGRLVARYPTITQVEQPAGTLVSPTRTYSDADWRPSLTVDTAGWEPGDYLFLLTDAQGHGRWVPLTVRSPSTSGAIVLINAVTTWQAYNAYGGYSLYQGPGGGYRDRAYAVSFDRPIDYGAGAGDFYGNELPVVELAEHLDLPVAYVTDTDIDADPHLLDGARAVISLGHDEYWSHAMRDEVTHDRDAHGMNVAFLGANAVYRHIRMSATALGPERLETDYKDGSLDPIAKTAPAQATYQWRYGPDPRPESVLTGAYYQCNPVQADMVVSNPASWLFHGVQVADGTRLAGLAGHEFDEVDLAVPTPRPIDVLFHSPVVCHGQHSFQDSAYYTSPSGAGGFDSGTSAWVCGLTPPCSPGEAQRDVVTTVTANLLKAFAAGPAGKVHPAVDDLARLGIG